MSAYVNMHMQVLLETTGCHYRKRIRVVEMVLSGNCRTLFCRMKTYMSDDECV